MNDGVDSLSALIKIAQYDVKLIIPNTKVTSQKCLCLIERWSIEGVITFSV